MIDLPDIEEHTIEEEEKCSSFIEMLKSIKRTLKAIEDKIKTAA